MNNGLMCSCTTLLSVWATQELTLESLPWTFWILLLSIMQRVSLTLPKRSSVWRMRATGKSRHSAWSSLLLYWPASRVKVICLLRRKELNHLSRKHKILLKTETKTSNSRISMLSNRTWSSLSTSSRSASTLTYPSPSKSSVSSNYSHCFLIIRSCTHHMLMCSFRLIMKLNQLFWRKVPFELVKKSTSHLVCNHLTTSWSLILTILIIFSWPILWSILSLVMNKSH